MAARVKADDVARKFALFCHTFGLRMATSYDDKGGFALDNYQGYVVVQFAERGGESHPFGNTRYSAREFVDVLYFAVEVERYRQNQQRGTHGNPRRNTHHDRQHPGATRHVRLSSPDAEEMTLRQWANFYGVPLHESATGYRMRVFERDIPSSGNAKAALYHLSDYVVSALVSGPAFALSPRA